MHGEAIWCAQDRSADGGDLACRDPSLRWILVRGDLELEGGVEDWDFLLSHLVECRLETGVEVIQGLLGLVERDVTATNERLGVELADRAHRVDLAVHQRLGVARVVALVVPVASVADHVDDDVLVEPLAERDRQPCRSDTGFRIVTVDMEDRGLDHLGDVGRVEGRSGSLGTRGEAHLIVDHDMNRSADAISREAREVERLGDDALTGEGRVAMDQHREDREVVLACAQRLWGPIGRRRQPILLGARHPLDDRAHRFEVRGVRCHGDRHRASRHAHKVA